jgi:hypothetical protein
MLRLIWLIDALELKKMGDLYMLRNIFMAFPHGRDPDPTLNG